MRRDPTHLVATMSLFGLRIPELNPPRPVRIPPTFPWEKSAQPCEEADHDERAECSVPWVSANEHSARSLGVTAQNVLEARRADTKIKLCHKVCRELGRSCAAASSVASSSVASSAAPSTLQPDLVQRQQGLLQQRHQQLQQRHQQLQQQLHSGSPALATILAAAIPQPSLATSASQLRRLRRLLRRLETAEEAEEADDSFLEGELLVSDADADALARAAAAGDALAEERRRVEDLVDDPNAFWGLEASRVTYNPHALPGTPQYERFVAAMRGAGAAAEAPTEAPTLKLVFHGTASKNVDAILEHGMDPSKRGEHGQAFGPGEYFSRHAWLSCAYTGGGKRLIIFAVLPGQVSVEDEQPGQSHGHAHAVRADQRGIIVVDQVHRQLPLATVTIAQPSEAVKRASNLSRQATTAAAAAAAAAKRAMRKAKVMQLLMADEHSDAAEVYAEVMREAHGKMPRWAAELRFYLRQVPREMVVALFPGVIPLEFDTTSGRRIAVSEAAFPWPPTTEAMNACDAAASSSASTDILGLHSTADFTEYDVDATVDAEVLVKQAASLQLVADEAEQSARKAMEEARTRRADRARKAAAAARVPRMGPSAVSGVGEGAFQLGRPTERSGISVEAPRGMSVEAPRGMSVEAPRGMSVEVPRGAVLALMKELRRLRKRPRPETAEIAMAPPPEPVAMAPTPAAEAEAMVATGRGEGGEFCVSLPDEHNLMRWRVAVPLPAESSLGRELLQFAASHACAAVVTLEVTFGCDFPASPPFVRVVSPRLAFHTGHVTIGGSMCMEVLTSRGWDPTYTVESILVMVRDAMIAGGGALDPRRAHVPYEEAEARSAFVRVARQHGWE